MANVSNYGLIGVGQNLTFAKKGVQLQTDGSTTFSLKASNGSTDAALTSAGITSSGNINANSSGGEFQINGDTTLSRAGSGIFQFNGTAAVVMPSGTTGQEPSAATYPGGFRYNSSTGTMEYSNGAGWVTMATGGTAVTAVTVNTANGFAGTSSVGTTPALTLSTTVTGILYGNGTSIAAATTANINAVGQLNQNTTGTATYATNVAGGAAGDLVYQTGAGVTSFVTAGTSAQVLTGGTTPSWSTMTSVMVTSFQTSLSGLTPSTTSTGTITLAGTLGIASGGTGQTTKSAAFNALSPNATEGDITYYNGTTNTNLAIGSVNQALVVSAGEPTWENVVNSVAVSGAAGSITVSAATGPSVTFALDANLQQLSSSQLVSTPGLVIQTGTSNQFITRTITAGSLISVTNGNGVSGAPTIAHGAVSQTSGGSFDKFSIDGFGHVDQITPVTQADLTGLLGTYYLATSGGTMTGELNMGGFTIDNLGTPVDADDAATKAYVDAATTGINVHEACVTATTADLGTLGYGHVIYENGTADADAGLGINAMLTNFGGPITAGTITNGGTGYDGGGSGTFTGIPLTGGGGEGAIATITVASGVVTTVVITSPGTNYDEGHGGGPSDVLSATTIGAAGGSGFTWKVTGTTESYGTLVLDGHTLTNLGPLQNLGYSYGNNYTTGTYTNVATEYVTGWTGPGTGLLVTVVVADNWEVSSVTLGSSGGTHYNLGDVITVSPTLIGGLGTEFAFLVTGTSAGGVVTSIGYTYGGAGYVNGTYLNVPLSYLTTIANTGGTSTSTFSGSTTGTLATADVTVSGGTVTSVTIVNAGTNFNAEDTLTVASSYLGGSSPTSYVAIEVGSVDAGRVLVKNEGNSIYNGIYNTFNPGSATTPWVLIRSADYNNSTAGQVTPGDFIFVSDGTINAGTAWVQTGIGTEAHEAIIIGTENIVFTQFGGPGSYTAGTGLTLVGTQFSVVSGAGISTSGPVGSAVNVVLHSPSSGGLILTTDGSTRSTAAGSGLDILSGQGLTQDSTGIYIANAGITNAMLANSSISLAASDGGGPSSINLGGSLTINGTANIITSVLSGTSGSAPVYTLDISGAYTGQTSIDTLGTVTTGTWDATTIAIAHGGTGLTTTPTNGQLLIGNGTNYTLATLTAGTGITITNGSGTISIAANSAALVTSFSGGTTGLTPSTATSGAIVLGGTLVVANGGTGLATLTTNGVVYGNGTSAAGVTAAGTQYQVLQAGSGGVPQFGPVELAQSAAVSGILPTTNGGTGLSSFTANEVFYAGSSSTVSQSANFAFDGTSTLTLGGASPITIDGANSTISATATNANLNLNANGTGTVNIGPSATTGLVSSQTGQSLTVQGYTGLTLQTGTSGGISLALHTSAEYMQVTTGPTASQYASNITGVPNAIPNVQYVQNEIAAIEALNGVVQTVSATFSPASGSTTTAIGSILPSGAIVIQVRVFVTVVDTTASISVGTTANNSLLTPTSENDPSIVGQYLSQIYVAAGAVQLNSYTTGAAGGGTFAVTIEYFN
jgi:hypothetical protein